MDAQPRRSSPLTTDRFRDQQIEVDVHGLLIDQLLDHPRAHDGSARSRLRPEAGSAESLAQQRVAAEERWVEGEVRVGGVGSGRQIAFAHPQVHGVSPNQDRRLALLAKSFEAVEQHATRGDVERIGSGSLRHRVAKTPRWPPSIRAAHRPRPACGPGR